MLVLSRKIGEEIVIDGNITVKVVDVRGSRVRLGIDAPKQTSVNRQELLQAASDPRHEELAVAV